MNELLIRPARATDAPAISNIYNHYIATSTATFDTEPKSADDRVAWLQERGERHPVIVAEERGVVVGWASLSPFRDRPAWVHTAEVAVYLEPGVRGRGLGARMMANLIETAETVGLHVLVSQVVADNHASIALAERAGFERVGTMREVGYKFGRWIDLAILQYVLPEPAVGGTS